jgi:hypothetical protein
MVPLRGPLRVNLDDLGGYRVIAIRLVWRAAILLRK